MKGAIKLSELDQIQSLAKECRIQFTNHASKIASERSINIMSDILPALKNGEIIEDYPEDYPYKSYLLLGYTDSGKPLHIVCAIVNNILWIITEYFPNVAQWESDFKTRKGQK